MHNSLLTAMNIGLEIVHPCKPHKASCDYLAQFYFITNFPFACLGASWMLSVCSVSLLFLEFTSSFKDYKDIFLTLFQVEVQYLLWVLLSPSDLIFIVKIGKAHDSLNHKDI